MDSKIPKTWEIIELGDIVNFRKGKKPKTMESFEFNDSLVYLDIKAIEKGTNDIYVDRASSNMSNENDILMVWDGARAGWVAKSRKGAIGSTIMALTSELNLDYLFRFLQTQFDYIQLNHKGTGIPHVDPSILYKVNIPIAPELEQRRIVVKLDSLFEKIESNKQRLEKIPKLLKRFRQSVLATLVNSDGTLDITGNVCVEIQIGPFGTQLHKHEYISNGVPLINPTHIQGGEIIPNMNLTVSKSKFAELSNYHLKTGDTIMGRRGEMARCALVGKKENNWLCGTGSLYFRPNLKKVHPQYLFWVLSNSNTKAFLESEAKGSTMSNLNLNIVRNIPICLPSLEQQTALMKNVERLFAFADKIEARYNKAKAMLDKLPQSILAKAFRGELVPQDPNDEPASVLLERIKAEKEKAKQHTANKRVKKNAIKANS